MILDGLVNFRDAGGIPLAHGGATRSGVLYRSDALAALTPEGVEQLAASPIGVIVDFRTDAERASAPDRLPASRAFTTVTLPVLEGAVTGIARHTPEALAEPAMIAAAIGSIPPLGELYIGMLTHAAVEFATVARLVAASRDDAPTAVLVHCTAGKDRTGVATALLLDAVGADRAAVVADYASTAANLAGPWAERMTAALAALGAPITPQIAELVTGSPASAIEHALAWLDAQPGGSAGYLRSGGLTDGELTALRTRLAG